MSSSSLQAQFLLHVCVNIHRRPRFRTWTQENVKHTTPKEKGEKYPLLSKKSVTSNVSSRPIKMSIWIFDVDGSAGMCGFCKVPSEILLDRHAVLCITYHAHNLAFHKSSNRSMQTIHIACHRQLEVVLRLLPLSSSPSVGHHYTNQYDHIPCPIAAEETKGP